MRLELKKAILLWIIDNIDDFQIVNNFAKEFKPYIYGTNGEYLIGGESIYKFGQQAITLLKSEME